MVSLELELLLVTVIRAFEVSNPGIMRENHTTTAFQAFQHECILCFYHESA